MYDENNDELLNQRVSEINAVPEQPPHRSMWGVLADRAQEKRQAKADEHAKHVRDLYDKIGSQLSDAMLEGDETLRNISVDSILRGVEQIQRKPVSKEFKTWLTKSPDQAFEVLTKIKERGVDPRVLFQTQDNPLLFAHGLLAMGKAKRELEARKLRGDGGDSPATSPSGPSSSEPEQLSGPRAEGSATAAPTEPAEPDVKSIVGDMGKRRDALRARVNALAAQGRDEKEIAPIRTELFSLDKQIRDAQLAAPQAAAVAGATANVQPVTTSDLAVAVDAAKRSGRPELAARFVPGMRRQAYDALVGQISGTTQNAATAVAPDASSASPSAPAMSPFALNQQAPNPARLGGMTAAPAPTSNPQVGGKAPVSMIQTPAESETEKAQIARREQKLPDDILRDPAVIKAGITTQGEFEDGVRNGSIHMMDLNEKARRASIAHEMGKTAVADFTAIKDAGNSARNLNKYYDILAASAERAGARGPWLTPVRETINNFANLMAVKDPSGQAPLQLMNSISMKLVPELTKQFKGSQSDREFMAGIASAPSTYNSEKGFAVLLMVGRELNKIHQEQDIQARKWVAKYGDLSSTNPNGDDFQTSFDKNLEKYNAEKGDLQARVSAAMKLKPKELLKAR